MTYCAIILAGGVGSRMRPMTHFIPKPLIPIKNKKTIEHQLDFLDSIGVKAVFILTGYKHNLIKKWLMNYDPSHLKNIKEIKLIKGKPSTKTFDRVMSAKNEILKWSDADGQFFGAYVLNCDTLFDGLEEYTIKDMADISHKTGSWRDATVLYCRIPERQDTLKNAGLYFLARAVFEFWTYKNKMLEDLIPIDMHIQIDNNAVFYDIGTPEGYEIARKKWKGNK